MQTLMRDFYCTLGRHEAHGIPFGDPQAEMCHECHCAWERWINDADNPYFRLDDDPHAQQVMVLEGVEAREPRRAADVRMHFAA